MCGASLQRTVSIYDCCFFLNFWKHITIFASFVYTSSASPYKISRTQTAYISPRVSPRRSVYFTIRLGLGEWQWDHLYGHAQGLVDHPGGPCEILLRGRRYWANTRGIVFVGNWWTCSGELIHLVKLLVRRVMIAKQQPEGCFVFSISQCFSCFQVDVNCNFLDLHRFLFLCFCDVQFSSIWCYDIAYFISSCLVPVFYCFLQ